MHNIELFPALGFDLSALSDEKKLIVLFSRTDLDDDIRTQAESILHPDKVDWDRFLELANVNQVTSLVYRSIQRFDGIPEKVLARLREWSADIFAYNIRNFDAARRLSELFREEEMEIIFTKGLPYLIDIYEDMGLREMADVDILVKPEDIRKVDMLLEGEGFAPFEEKEGLDDYRAQKLYFRGDGIHLDVHRGFVGRMLHNRVLGIDPEKAWENKRELRRDDVRIDTLDLTHTLVYQCLHLSMQHSFSGIRWYVDINEFVRKYEKEIDWDRLVDAAGEYRIRKPVYYSLLFTKDMFDAPVPGRVMKELSGATGRWDRWFFRRIKANATGVDYLAELAMFDNCLDAAKFIMLSFVFYPRRILHFFGISGSIFKALLWKKKS